MGVPKQRWTPEEEAALKAGVAKHGPGKWRTILRDPDFSTLLRLRSNVDLKVTPGSPGRVGGLVNLRRRVFWRSAKGGIGKKSRGPSGLKLNCGSGRLVERGVLLNFVLDRDSRRLGKRLPGKICSWHNLATILGGQARVIWDYDDWNFLPL